MNVVAAVGVGVGDPRKRVGRSECVNVLGAIGEKLRDESFAGALTVIPAATIAADCAAV
jgi:hypothetical protein